MFSGSSAASGMLVVAAILSFALSASAALSYAMYVAAPHETAAPEPNPSACVTGLVMFQAARSRCGLSGPVGKAAVRTIRLRSDGDPRRRNRDGPRFHGDGDPHLPRRERLELLRLGGAQIS